MDVVRLRPAGAGGRRRSRSRSRAAARRQPHQQLAHAHAVGAGRGEEMVAEVDGVVRGSPAVVGLLRMRPLTDGIRRVNAAPAILAGVWLLTFVVSLPLALAMRGLVEHHLGASLAADSAAAGVNYDWMQEFSDQATGVASTLRPSVIGFAAVLDNASGFIDNTADPVVIVGA